MTVLYCDDASIPVEDLPMKTVELTELKVLKVLED